MKQCSVCGSKNTKHLFVAQNIHGRHIFGSEEFPIIQCQDCLVAATDINIDQKYYEKYYRDDYYSTKKSSGIINIFCEFLKIKGFESRLRLIRKHASHAERILEIGCGMGEFLRFIKGKYQCSGIEINTQACDFIKNNYPEITVFDKRIDTDALRIEDFGKYDCIIMWQVLEHIECPQRFIENIKQLLSDKGIVIFDIPNRNSIGFKLTKKWWFHLDAPRHLFHYNYGAIKKLFKQSLWKIEEVKGNKIDYIHDLGVSVYVSLKTGVSLLDKAIFIVIVPIFSIIRFLVSWLWTLNSEITTYVIRKNNN